MLQILNQLQNQLQALPMPVYLAYDHMPAAQKATPFVVLSLQACQTEAPVFRSEQETVPFSATVTVTLLMPIETHAATAESANGSTLCTQTRPPTQSADYHGNLSAIWVFSV